jgi:REP element-mobilizing transposase RayT
MEKKGWHSRGYLPHYDCDKFQFVTFRLADSLPQSVLKKFEQELKHKKLDHFYDREFQIKIEEYLDRGIGACELGQAAIAEILIRSLLMFNGERYILAAWVVMPNHGHILLKPLPGFSLTSIMKGLKGNTANQANKFLGRKGRFWHPDYFDRYIRDETHFRKTVRYIENNPVKAGLVETPDQWEYSSAYIG